MLLPSNSPMLHQINPHSMMAMHRPMNMHMMPRPMNNLRMSEGKIDVIGKTINNSSSIGNI